MQNESVTVYISLGSNLGDRAGNLLLAVRALLEASFEVRRLSAIYETEPVEVEAGEHGKFLNMVAEACVKGLTPHQMMARLIRIEYLLGRHEKNLKKPRTADLDLLFCGTVVQQTEFLTLPHPRLHLRRFVLVPLNELSPHLVHPKLNLTVAELLAQTPDTSHVKRFNPAAPTQKS